MPKITPYRFSFRSGLHIGTRGVNLEEAGLSLPADTLFAACVDAWRRKNGDSREFAGLFSTANSAPPMLFSSAFPYAGRLLFFPMPVDLTRLFERATLQHRGKQLQRIRFLSQGLLDKALSGQKLDADLFPLNEWEEPETGAALQGGAAWMLLSEMEQLPREFQRARDRRHALRTLRVWSMQQLPRVTVGRITSASNLFHAGRVVFAKDCGLWFGIQWLKPEAPAGHGMTCSQAFEQALQMLQDDGIGGERSTGYGTFDAAAGELFELGSEPKPGGLSYLLSRYHPAENELPGALTGRQDVAYQMTAVAGWLRSPDSAAQRRKRVFMLNEGSLICQPDKNPAGEVTNVAPRYASEEQGAPEFPHQVYRYGLALSAAWPETPGRN
jgi:CRISPR-associated protein Csm4